MTGRPHTTLVAGGSGFLGSHICTRLIDQGDTVVCVDDYSTGAAAKVAHLVGHERFHLVEHDIVTPFASNPTLAVLLAKHGPTRIFNLASPASPPAYQKLAIETLMVGSVGMRNILDLAVATGARVMQASTSEVYGDPEVHPQPESYWGHVNSVGPRSMYDESKRFAEALCVAYERVHGVDVRLPRIFNTYGPGMSPDDGRVVTNFIGQALRGHPLTIYGDGKQTRSFCFVDDEVRGLLALLESDLTGPVNIGNPLEFTMLELAELVIDVAGTASVLTYLPLPGDDPTQRQPNIERAIVGLGWEPQVALRDGIERTMAWFRSLPGFA